MEYVQSCVQYTLKHAKENYDKYFADTLKYGWAEVELKNTIAKNTKKLLQEQKRILEKQKNEEERKNRYNAKLAIQAEWHNLSQDVKALYLEHANTIFKSCEPAMHICKNLADDLPICIYAVSSGRTYNKALEGYLKNILHVDISINQTTA